MDDRHILAIDQGTTSSRAMVFSGTGHCAAQAQQEFRQIYPQDGWVEHDPEEIWQSVLAVCRQALQQANSASTVSTLATARCPRFWAQSLSLS